MEISPEFLKTDEESNSYAEMIRLGFAPDALAENSLMDNLGDSEEPRRTSMSQTSDASGEQYCLGAANDHSLPIAERSRLLRAKRNREAAHRSRTKNKLRQTLLEEETERLLKLNQELQLVLAFMLSNLKRSSAAVGIMPSLLRANENANSKVERENK